MKDPLRSAAGARPFASVAGVTIAFAAKVAGIAIAFAASESADLGVRADDAPGRVASQVDLYGDPLPDGAMARQGWRRFLIPEEGDK